MVLAFGALAAVRTGFAVLAVTLVFPVSLAVCCGVLQDLVCRADVAVIVFIVNVLMFPEEAFLRHRPFVGKQGLNFIIQEEFRNSRCFVTGIQNDCLQLWILNLVINPFECPAVMFVSWIDGESQNPSMLVTSCFNRVGKYLFVLSFVKPAAVWICRANRNFLLLFAGGFSG